VNTNISDSYATFGRNFRLTQWVITQQVVVIYYRRFGSTYRHHRKGSRIQKIWILHPWRWDR